MLKYLELFNWVLTIVILVCIYKLALTHLKIILLTNYWLTNHMYNHLTVCKSWALIRLKCYLQTMRLQIIYNMYNEDLALNNM